MIIKLLPFGRWLRQKGSSCYSRIGTAISKVFHAIKKYSCSAPQLELSGAMSDSRINDNTLIANLFIAALERNSGIF